MIVLDFGSGNTCRNNVITAKRMIDALADVTDRRDIVIKWQLFSAAPPNIALDADVFMYAYYYARELGFESTASVFDVRSLNFLLKFPVPFVKLANRRDTDHLISHIPRRIPVVQSFANQQELQQSTAEYPLCCVSEYPATYDMYMVRFNVPDLRAGISDHTVGFDLYNRYKPCVWEKHYALEHDESNPDAGPFAITPKELGEIL